LYQSEKDKTRESLKNIPSNLLETEKEFVDKENLEMK